MSIKEFDLLKKLERVKAPPDFEQKVLSQLSLRKKQMKTRYLRLSLAGAFSAVVVLLVVINVFILPQKGPMGFIGLKKSISSGLQKEEPMGVKSLIPIIEPLDYRSEIKSFSEGLSTIYILEQVSEKTSSKINY